jgi:hypothetical protein
MPVNEIAIKDADARFDERASRPRWLSRCDRRVLRDVPVRLGN